MKTTYLKDCLLKLIERQQAQGEFRLAPERVLAERYLCSRATISKVLSELSAEGIIERRLGSGTYIRTGHPSPASGVRMGLLMRRSYTPADDHFRSIVDSASEHAACSGIQLEIFDRLGDLSPSEYRDCLPLQAHRRHRIDCFLLVSRLPLQLAGLLAGSAPCLSINNLFGDCLEIPGITCDYFRVGYLAGHHLASLGHRHIAYVTDDFNHPETSWELSGFRTALASAGIDLRSDDLLETLSLHQSFTKRCGEFFAPLRHTACFLRTLNLVRPLRAFFASQHIAIPGDLSLVVTGDFSRNRLGENQFTVIDTRLPEMCRLAMDTLSARVRNRHLKVSSIQMLAPHLIERQSVRCH